MISTAFKSIDFDLHGLVGIRLVHATAGDEEAVRRQLGPLEQPLDRPPDITIRFVRQLSVPASMGYLGAREIGFTEDAFWVLRGKHKSPAKVMIPVAQLGSQCEIVCESGLAAVPLLIPIINLTALYRGAVPLHAAAFEYRGVGVLVTGWSKGGKTETLLSFMSQGATYVGDEWVYLQEDGRMSGIPEPIRVWDWHLDSLPEYRSRAGRGSLLRVGAMKRACSAVRLLPEGPWLPGELKHRLLPLLQQQTHVDVAPARLFGDTRMSCSTQLDRLFFVVSHASPEIHTLPIDSGEVADRMVHSLQYEQSRFNDIYRMFRFAFPGTANPRIEQCERLQRQRLVRALAGVRSYAVYHPYPVSLTDLFEAIAPCCPDEGLRAELDDREVPR